MAYSRMKCYDHITLHSHIHTVHMYNFNNKLLPYWYEYYKILPTVHQLNCPPLDSGMLNYILAPPINNKIILPQLQWFASSQTQIKQYGPKFWGDYKLNIAHRFDHGGEQSTIVKVYWSVFTKISRYCHIQDRRDIWTRIQGNLLSKNLISKQWLVHFTCVLYWGKEVKIRKEHFTCVLYWGKEVIIRKDSELTKEKWRNFTTRKHTP